MCQRPSHDTLAEGLSLSRPALTRIMCCGSVQLTCSAATPLRRAAQLGKLEVALGGVIAFAEPDAEADDALRMGLVQALWQTSTGAQQMQARPHHALHTLHKHRLQGLRA